jgi:hypothetical protein
VDAASGNATLEDAIDALYAAALGDFVNARNTLAQALKQRGDKEGAARIKALPKPSLPAWAVNQLWWHARAELQVLLEEGQVVRQLHRTGAGAAQQSQATRRRRTALDSLLRLAESLLHEGGHASGAATLRRISTTLEALAAYGDQTPPPGPGRLVEDLAPPGFEALGGLAFAAAPAFDAPPPGPTVSPVIELTRPVDDPTAARLRFARQALDNAEQSAIEAARAVDSAAAAADDAEAAASSAEQAYRRARTEAEAAARRAEHAQTEWRRSAKRAEALEEAAAAARTRQRDADAEVQRRRDALAAVTEPPPRR